MKRTYMLKTAVILLATLALAGMTAQRSLAVTYNLVAEEFAKSMPDGSTITMWGFRLASDPVATSPGPELVVPPGDNTLTINLTNNLPANIPGVPKRDLYVGFMIPGLLATGSRPLAAPYTSPNQGTPDGTTIENPTLSEIYSFERVALPGGGTKRYTFTNVPSGVYFYHSSANPALHVPMGLFGAMTHYAVSGAEPFTGVTLGGASAASKVLMVSEVDPKISAAVYGGQYGKGAVTFENHPKWFFINGASFTEGASPITWLPHGSEYMFHLINAGVQQHALTLTQGEMLQYTEDNHLLPMPMRRNSINVAPSQVYSVKVIPPAAYGRTFALYDRSLDTKNSSPATFGMVPGVGGIFMPFRTDFAAACGYDLNGDGIPDAADLTAFNGSGELGRSDCTGLNGLLSPAWCAYDFNADGAVDTNDQTWLTANNKLNGVCAAAPAPVAAGVFPMSAALEGK